MHLKLIILLLVFVFMIVLKKTSENTNYIEYQHKRKYLAVFTCILLILQSGLRNIAVGPDTYNYFLSFQEHINWSWKQTLQNFSDVYIYGEGKDAGYYFLVKCFSLFSRDYQVFLLFVATIFFIPLMRFIYKNTSRLEDIWIALLLYQALFYSFFSITGIRQTIATGLCLISFELIKNKKLIPFILLILIGTFIHKSCLLFLPFYWIANIKNVKTIFLLAIIAFPILVAIGSAFTLQLAIISGSENYLNYVDEESTGAKGLITFYLLISLTGFIKYWRNIEWLNQRSHIFNAISLGILFLPLTLNSANLVRVVQYYSIFLLIFISYVITPNKQIIANFPNKLVNVLIILALTYKLLSTPAEYAFFWEYMPITF